MVCGAGRRGRSGELQARRPSEFVPSGLVPTIDLSHSGEVSTLPPCEPDSAIDWSWTVGLLPHDTCVRASGLLL